MFAFARRGSGRRSALQLIVFVLVAACGGTKETPAADPSASASTPATAEAPSPAPAAAPAVAAADGKAIYARCATCHQANGDGLTGAFPPLNGSEWVTGNPEVPIRILLHGLNGPITVKGVTYNAVMMAGGTGVPLSDAELAAVLTYIRTSWSNTAGPVTAEQVASVRAATSGRKTPWTAAELSPLLGK